MTEMSAEWDLYQAYGSSPRPQSVFRFVWWQKIYPFLSQHKWGLLALSWIITMLLGFRGYQLYFDLTGDETSFTAVTYEVLRLFVIEAEVSGDVPLELDIARFLAPFLIALTGFQAFLIVFQEQVQNFSLKRKKRHVVVCGLSDVGGQLASDYLRRGSDVVVITDDPQNRLIPTLRQTGAIVVVGDATSEQVLQYVRTAQAEEVFATTGDDGMNVEVAVHVYNLVREGSRRVLCYVNIVELQLRNLLKQHAITTNPKDPFELRFFNIFENAAKQLFRSKPANTLVKIDQPRKTYHFVVVGFGKMGQSVTVQSVQRFQHVGATNLHITVVDIEPDERISTLRKQYPLIDDLCRLESHQMDVNDRKFLDREFWSFPDKPFPDLVIICMDKRNIGVSIAMSLLPFVPPKVPLYVQTNEESGLATILLSKDLFLPSQHVIVPFGMVEDISNRGIVVKEYVDRLAQAFHDSYLKLQQRLGHDQSTNPFMVPWDLLVEERKEAHREKAEHLEVKLRAVGCYLSEVGDKEKPFKFRTDEVEFLAMLEHSRWMANRKLSGWRHGTGTKDPQAKTNPLLVPWQELPKEVQEWNREHVRKLPMMLIAYGVVIRRLS